MCILDAEADGIVGKHAELQRAIQGLSPMFAVPGLGSYLLANAGLMFGWMGSSLSVYGMFESNPTTAVSYLAVSLLAVTMMSILIYRVLRGNPHARTRIFIYSVSLVDLGVMNLAAAFIHGQRPGVVVGIGGLFASGVAARCIAGANYALLAAFFRAKRVHGGRVEAELRRLRPAKDQGSGDT